MAIYHFSGTVISRSQGRSSIAAAAYRSGEKLYDERQERSLDYSRKQDVIYKEVMLPQSAPEWMDNREKLWNAVEAAENRKDSQLAREINFSLPRELSQEQNIELATDFVKNEFVSKGMIADLCIHAGKNKKGEEQPHAHIMLTLRGVTKEGFGLKERGWNGKENYMFWREAWAEYANKYLALNGIDQKIDHRSFADQGINLVSQTRIAAKNSKDYERSVAAYRRIARENGERLLADPNIALHVITYRQSTFTHNDLARFINRHTVDAEQFQEVYAKVKASGQVIALGKDEKNTERFTTKEMVALEKKMLSDVGELENSGHALKFKPLELKTTSNIDVIEQSRQDQHPLGSEGRGVEIGQVTASNSVSAERNVFIGDLGRDSGLTNTNKEIVPSIVDKTITGFLAMNTDETDARGVLSSTEQAMGSINNIINLSSQQEDALEHITEAGDIKCLIGYAGTGKSHILREAREAWEGNGYNVSGITLSGIAAENLEGASSISSRTFASRSYCWDSGREHLTKKDILVIDEAGMLGTRQMARVVDEAKSGGAKLVLIGDPQQLQAIEAGAAFRAIATKTNYLELTEVRRQLEPWQQAATKEFALRDVKSAIDRYNKHDHVHSFEGQDSAKTALVQMWNDVRISQPDKTQIILAYTRKDAQELNEIARDYRKQNNELGEDHKLLTSSGNKTFAEGDRIYFLRNNRDLGVMNGTLGNIEAITNNRLTVAVDRDDFKGNKVDANRQVVNLDLDCYNHITHGYAATIHKAQGVTVDRSYVLASQHLDSHATYVGMSRHRESVDLFWSKEEFSNDQRLLYALSRDRSKDIALDYIQDPDKEYEREALLRLDKEEQLSQQERQKETAEAAISSPLCEPGQPVAESAEEFLETKINIIVKECTKLINSINYCNAKQEEFAKEGTTSPFIKECLDENKESIKQCLRENCKDRVILKAFKQQEPQLFNEINKACNDILANTVKSVESRELLAALTKDRPGLYEKVMLAEKEYKELRQEYIERYKQTNEKAENWSEYSRILDGAKEAERHLEKHANELYKDIVVTQAISQHDPELFSEMDKRFDNMFTSAIEHHNLHENFINEKHPEFSDTTLTKEERQVKMYDQYQELKQEYLESQHATESKAENWAEYSQRLDVVEEAKEHLYQYANEAYKDNDFMDYLGRHDEKTFNEMSKINERFNEIMREQMKEMQHELEKEF
jgi:ATP-dependent exoDNAse (exonuclease V) alpha subunit